MFDSGTDNRVVDTFSSRLQKALNYRNIRSIDLANKLGLNRGIISQYITGKYEPKMDRLYSIAKALDVSVSYLLGYDVDIEYKENIAPERIDEIQDEVTTLFSKYRDVLTPEDKEYIKFIIEKRLRDLENK